MAKQYARTALELNKSLRPPLTTGYPKNIILQSFVLSGKLDSAALMIPTFTVQDFDGYREGVVSHYQVLALYHLKNREFSKADSMVNLCYPLVEKYQIPASAPSGVIDPDYYAALIRMEQKDYQAAIRLLELDLLRVRNIRSHLIRDHELFADLYTKIGDYKNANIAYANYISLQKSLETDQAKYATLSFETEQQIAASELALTNL